MQLLTLSMLVCVWTAASTLGVDHGCRFPPELWCSSPEVASACQVIEQCAAQERRQVNGAAPPVNFTLYYESLCPDCQDLIKKQLYPAFLSVGSIMNLTLVPYGNAREEKRGDKWVFNCQHGEQECIGNILDTCLLKIVNNVKIAFPFIHCMEVSGQEKSMKAFKMCSSKFPSLPLDRVEKCAGSAEGNMWEHEMAQRTDALVPPHKYVPWVTLNGVHNEVIQKKAQEDLVKLLCETYTGTKPAGCQQRRNSTFHFKEIL